MIGNIGLLVSSQIDRKQLPHGSKEQPVIEGGS